MATGIRGLGLALASALWATLALAAGPEEPATDDAATGPFVEGMAAAESENWEDAVLRFSEAAQLDPESADALNMLAYSQRHLGDLETAIENYGKALELDPQHEGAREYLGEALLLAGDLDGAKRQLKALEGICPQGCEALEELREAIGQHEAGNQ